MTHIKIVCTKHFPTLYFIKHEGLGYLMMLDDKGHTKLNYANSNAFKLDTQELIRYES